MPIRSRHVGFLRLPSRNTDRIWTDRYRGTVISKPCLIESASVEYYADGIDDGHHMSIKCPSRRSIRAPIVAALEAAGKNPATSMHTTAARTRPPDSRAGSRTPPCAIQPAPSRFPGRAH